MKAESIEYVLNALGGDGAYRRSGNHLMANCVHAEWGHSSGQDKDHKLGVLVQDGISPCNCFFPGCLPESAHTLLGLVSLIGGKRIASGTMMMQQVSNLKSFVLMAEEDDDVETDASWGASKPKQPIPPSILDVCTGTAPYWVSRGISPETAAAWKLGQDQFRAHMPLMNQAGAIVAVQGRLLPGVREDNYAWDVSLHDEKYRSFPVGFERAALLVGEHRIMRPVETLVVVESPFDAIALSDWLSTDPASVAGSWAVVATMGGEVAAQQAQKMVEFVNTDGELVLGMDMDHAGRLSTRRLIGYDPQHPGHRLYRRLPRISEVEWVRKDVTDLGEPAVSLDVARADALKALANRIPWLERRFRTLAM